MTYRLTIFNRPSRQTLVDGEWVKSFGDEYEYIKQYFETSGEAEAWAVDWTAKDASPLRYVIDVVDSVPVEHEPSEDWAEVLAPMIAAVPMRDSDWDDAWNSGPGADA